VASVGSGQKWLGHHSSHTAFSGAAWAIPHEDEANSRTELREGAQCRGTVAPNSAEPRDRTPGSP
jgi:hypothetical protein